MWSTTPLAKTKPPPLLWLRCPMLRVDLSNKSIGRLGKSRLGPTPPSWQGRRLPSKVHGANPGEEQRRIGGGLAHTDGQDRCLHGRARGTALAPCQTPELARYLERDGRRSRLHSWLPRLQERRADRRPIPPHSGRRVRSQRGNVIAHERGRESRPLAGADPVLGCRRDSYLAHLASDAPFCGDPRGGALPPTPPRVP